jgi:DNA-directed RNA polymerase specialized sigma24 family protein
MLMTTDTFLTQRAARGDRDAYEAVYDASFPRVYAFAVRRTGERRGAERLCERILRRVFRDLHGYAGDVPFAAWLLGVAKQVAHEHAAARRRVGRVAPGAPAAHVAPR